MFSHILNQVFALSQEGYDEGVETCRSRSLINSEKELRFAKGLGGFLNNADRMLGKQAHAEGALLG